MAWFKDMRHPLLAVLLLASIAPPCRGLATPGMDRRKALFTGIGSALSFPSLAISSDEATDRFAYELRDRDRNKQALIREDYWYMAGKQPPRVLVGIKADDPKWNAWGTCETSETTGNSCTYVSLKQKIPAYSKYAFNIALGAKEYEELGKALEGSDLDRAAEYLNDSPTGSPPPAVDALLKAALLAAALLTSPNYSGPPKEFLISRFYVNEADFAVREITAAIGARDTARAKAAWDFGKDSWNSYFFLVNRAIVPKVGDKFELIA